MIPITPYAGQPQQALIPVPATIAYKHLDREESCWVMPPYALFYPPQAQAVPVRSMPRPRAKVTVLSFGKALVQPAATPPPRRIESRGVPIPAVVMAAGPYIPKRMGSKLKRIYERRTTLHN